MRVVDLNSILRDLHRAVMADTLGVLERGHLVASALAELEPADRATVATCLAHDLIDLKTLGRGGLHVLRRALRLDDDERCEHALLRVDAALRALGPLPIRHTDDGTWVLGVGSSPSRLGEVMLLSPEPRKTTLALLCEHYLQCHDELPHACCAALKAARSLVPAWA